MLKEFFKKLSGRHYKKFQKFCFPIIDKINSIEQEMQNWTAEKLKQQTEIFKQRISQGESLDDILPEAFATVKNAARRLCGTNIEVCGNIIKWDMLHYDVQLLGGIALHRGYIAEMATGEGKTLVATLPLYLNSLSGKNCQLVTVNEYLALRDSTWMGYLFKYLGLTVGCIQNSMDLKKRYEAYRMDITYGTASEFGFDYLRDNGMAISAEDQVQRDHYYCIIDEIDSVLIDEARTPLIISGESDDDSSIELFVQLNLNIKRLYELQMNLCNHLVKDSMPYLTENINNEEMLKGLEMLFQVKCGDPHNHILLKLLEEGRICRAFNKFEMQMLADYNNKRSYELKEYLYYTIDEKTQQAGLTEKGRDALNPNDKNAFVLPDLTTIFSEIDSDHTLNEDKKIKEREKIENLYIKRNNIIHCINQLLRAYTLYTNEVHYVVMNGEVMIIDENTGRIMKCRRWSDGLHQAIEAKEGTQPQKESKTYASITLQNYFRLYTKLAGMTGTAETEATEFLDIYNMKVMVIPTNKQCMRIDENDSIYKTIHSKFNAVINLIKNIHNTGQPILVGTTSVETSEALSLMLKKNKIAHSVLNAKYHQQEAEIISKAGDMNAVTIATNMAGRGTDIKLGEGVAELGGLYVIGTERYESRRIDRQLIGRCARQGDPGHSKFFLSLEDNLMRLFANAGKIGAFLERSMRDEDELNHPLLNRSIQSAQKKVEQRNYSMRKRLLQYDDVLNKQRSIIYGLRNEILRTDDTINMMFDFIHEEIINQLSLIEIKNSTEERLESFSKFINWINLHIPLFLSDTEFRNKKADQISNEILEKIKNLYQTKHEIEGDEVSKRLSRFLMLRAIDDNWQEQLTELDNLRQSIGLRGYGQKDPLIEYKMEAYKYFESMISKIRQHICINLFRLSDNASNMETFIKNINTNIDFSHDSHDDSQSNDNIVNKDNNVITFNLSKPSINTEESKIGRNDLCPCGSGKKYKKCCGKNLN